MPEGREAAEEAALAARALSVTPIRVPRVRGARREARRAFPWRAWVEASRPRMLSLGLASGVVPGAVAAYRGVFDGWVLLLSTLLSTLLLVVSCWADEYGDLEKGVDNDQRLGPIRPVQRGEITMREILTGSVIGATVAFGLGVALVLYSFGTSLSNWREMAVFTLVGLVGIAAAFGYTMGKKPYGYRGFGDLSAFLFFGLVAGLGGFYLYAHTIEWSVLLPMSGVGALFVSTINLQNLRDFDNDRACGKITTAVVLGRPGAIVYQFVLVIGSMAAYLAFPLLEGISDPWRYAFVLAFSPLVTHLLKFTRIVRSYASPRTLDTLMWPLTRAMGLLALLFALGVGL